MASKTILVVSEPGFGRIRTPFSASERPHHSSHSLAPNESEGKAKRTSKRIAIVDDDEELASVFSLIVERLGHQVEFVAHDGNEIVRAVLDNRIRPDIILIDFRMSPMNGIQAAEKILQARPDIRIVIATADDSARHEADALGLYFLQKPFSKSSLAVVIDSIPNS